MAGKRPLVLDQGDTAALLPPKWVSGHRFVSEQQPDATGESRKWQPKRSGAPSPQPLEQPLVDTLEVVLDQREMPVLV